LHELVNVVPANACEFWHKRRLGHAGLGIDLDAEEATRSLDAIVEAEIRNSSRPAAKRHMRRQR
jgi:hypothetical protein